ncbi:hypothetical protein REPUB_Repub02eG0043900 [Reevesia pubescens]
MLPVHSSPYFQMDNPAAIQSLLRPTPGESKHRKSSSSSGGLFRMFKLFPMLSSGCKMVALLDGPRKPMLKDSATTGTIFGYRRGRVCLAIQDDPHCEPMFVIELPMLTGLLQKEMASDIVRIALESETKTHKKKLLQEFVWAVYCNGRKMGYSIRRNQLSDDELHVMQLLRGVSMGAGVLPSLNEKGTVTFDGELTYMINPDGAPGTELSIFFVRAR